VRHIHKFTILFLGVIFGVGLFFKVAVLDNPKVLFRAAAGFDVPSYPYYFLMERIYKLYSRGRDIGDYALQKLEEGQDENLETAYVKTLGIIGKSDSAAVLMKLYSKYQNNPKRQSTLSQIVESMGLIDNEDLVPLLERLLRNHSKLDVQVTRYAVGRALYLMTGRTYPYTESSSKDVIFPLTDQLREARRIVQDSHGRRRTFDEMVKLAKPYRPPGW